MDELNEDFAELRETQFAEYGRRLRDLDRANEPTVVARKKEARVKIPLGKQVHCAVFAIENGLVVSPREVGQYDRAD